MVVAGPGLDQSKSAYALTFVQRQAFLDKYKQGLTAAEFVDSLLASILTNSGADLSSQRDSLISMYDGTNTGRAKIVKTVADASPLVDAEYNRSFVLMEYFGYLRRDPDQDGLAFWLGQVNRYPLRDTRIQQGMACAFITSAEYQLRFGTVISHHNADCPSVPAP